MTSLQLALAVLVFLATVVLVLGVVLLTRKSKTVERLETLVGEPKARVGTEPNADREAWVRTVARVAAPFAKLSVPSDDWQSSALRRKFMQAGLRHESAPLIFFGLKTILAIALPVGFWLLNASSPKPVSGTGLISYSAILMGAGFYLPNYLLKRSTTERQKEVLESFPDALDLLTICVEAGSSLDSALSRVAGEIGLKSKVLAEELELVVLEMRAGAGKERALRNLSLRTGVDDIDTFVATMVQSDKFGTSIGQALRVHSDMLRTKRQQRAEEAAAKVALKLLFPLILFIFPSILIVVGGPAMLSIMKELPKLIGGGGL